MTRQFTTILLLTTERVTVLLGINEIQSVQYGAHIDYI